MDYLELEITLDPLEPGRDLMIADLGAIGFESFEETQEGFKAYIPQKDFDQDLLDDLLNNLPWQFSLKKRIIKAMNWNMEWERNFRPITVGDKCLVKASFHEVHKNYPIEITIDPKMSFGTGHHSTTWLMMRQMLKMNYKDKKVLDMGAGTGVLAILAEKLGAHSILAIDIDEWAFENARENIQANRCRNIRVIKGNIETVKRVKESNFDILLANINKNVILEDLKSYKHLLSREGQLLLSGFFVEDTEDILAEARKIGLSLIEREDANNWALLHLKQNS